MKKSFYNNEFFQSRVGEAYYSAFTILNIVKENILNFDSVVDIGTGTGTWLKAAEKLGASKIKGYEGFLEDTNLLEIPSNCFEIHDLEKPIKNSSKFDLALCLEVGEHIECDHSKTLVSSITNLSDNITFSAAIPGQLGVGHINEQWPDFWISLFSSKGYNCIDVIRPKIWTNSKIPFWYKQNCLFFTKDESLTKSLMPNFQCNNLVHPELYASKLENNDKSYFSKLKKFF